jgi:hypothetical protein
MRDAAEHRLRVRVARERAPRLWAVLEATAPDARAAVLVALAEVGAGGQGHAEALTEAVRDLARAVRGATTPAPPAGDTQAAEAQATMAALRAWGAE